MTDTLIDLIRHGEPLGGRMFRGQRDDPLSEHGWAQMRRAVGDACPWHLLVSSPLRRCASFARELAQRHDRELRIEPDLQEVGFGTWEGRTRAELEAGTPGVVARFYRDPVANRPRGAEPLQDFRARVEAGWQRILARHCGQHVLVVAHAGVIRMVVAGVLGTPLENLYRLQVPNAGITRVALAGGPAAPVARLFFHGATTLPTPRN